MSAAKVRDIDSERAAHPAVAGAFSVPRIISRGLQAEWFSQSIYNKFFESENSNVGAAYSLAYTLVCFVLVGLFMWAMRTRLKDFARVQ